MSDSLTTVRKQLILSADLDQEINNLAASKATSASEIMRRAITLYIRAAELEKDGMSMGFSRDKNKLDTQVVGL